MAGVGFSLSRRVFHCLQARGMTVVTGVLRAGVLHGVRSDAGGGLVGIAVGHKGEIGVGKRERVMFIRSPLRNAHRQAPSLAVKPPYTRRREEGEKREEDTNRHMCTNAPTCALTS